tara:strand:+ start:288 stop:1046 length:759 start_codon:yes stop_codon:yes gene_type:complete
MKKSQLRKIIKESIKGLMTEQSAPITYSHICNMSGVANTAGFNQYDCIDVHANYPGNAFYQMYQLYADFGGSTYPNFIPSDIVNDPPNGQYNDLASCQAACVPPPCDNSTAGACAQTWFGPRAGKMGNFVSAYGNGRNCTGNYNYGSVFNRFYNKWNNRKIWTINKIEQNQPQGWLGQAWPGNSLPNSTVIGQMFDELADANNYSQIANSAESLRILAGINKKKSDKIIRFTAKKGWAQCMMTECSCPQSFV